MSAAPPSQVAAVVLAAGLSRRMGADNKLLLDMGGKPLLRWAGEAAAGSKASQLIVVTGHQSTKVRDVVADLDPQFVENPDYADGLGTSVAAGVAALGPGVDAVLVVLGDMPTLTATDLDRLIASFDPENGREIVVPVVDGKRGNPVLWGQRFFPDLCDLDGDQGGRALISENADAVVKVEMGAGIRLDVDTPQALAAARAHHD